MERRSLRPEIRTSFVTDGPKYREKQKLTDKYFPIIN